MLNSIIEINFKIHDEGQVLCLILLKVQVKQLFKVNIVKEQLLIKDATD